MRKISWKRWVIALALLSICCVLCIVLNNVYFFFAGLAIFFVILIAPFVG